MQRAKIFCRLTSAYDIAVLQKVGEKGDGEIGFSAEFYQRFG